MSIQLSRFNGDIRVETSEDGITIYPLKSLSGIFLSWKELENIVLSASASNIFLVPILSQLEKLGDQNAGRNSLWNREPTVLSTPVLSRHEKSD